MLPAIGGFVAVTAIRAVGAVIQTSVELGAIVDLALWYAQIPIQTVDILNLLASGVRRTVIQMRSALVETKIGP